MLRPSTPILLIPLAVSMSLAGCGSDTRPFDFNTRNGVGSTNNSSNQTQSSSITPSYGGNTSINSDNTTPGIPTNIGGNTSIDSDNTTPGIPTNIGGNTSIDSDNTTPGIPTNIGGNTSIDSDNTTPGIPTNIGGNTSNHSSGGSSGVVTDAVGGTSSGGAACQLPSRVPGCVASTSPTNGWMFAFNPASERCERVRHEDCIVGAFAQLEDCINSCDPGGLTECTQPSDCIVRDLGCCGHCEPHQKTDLTAVSTSYSGVEVCANDVQCGPCPDYAGPATASNFGATCAEGKCQIFDIRDQPESICTEDTDCRLRRGLDCCEDCSDDSWVAINVNATVGAERCTATSNCTQCIGITPSNLSARCVAGHCTLIKTI